MAKSVARRNLKALIQREYRDSDGYWIDLVSGHRLCDDYVHGIVEDTKAKAYRTLQSVVTCDCDDCKQRTR